MAKSKAKAKSNKKQKQNKDSDHDDLEPNEYVVGTLLVPTSVRARLHPQRVSREDPQSKGPCHSENCDSLGERTCALASFPAS